ncbi:GNAT family N-acetyltransferase [Paraburkholderia sp. NMBU_R16]|uniref:GNAT family N-acetyltransferase n=1 Tax=Paraburkholderia sp. NMBU_R16 TaxID=2698676 RepID=UPI0015642C50|nr:GNAT family N-acetyltransferase [Paraburkholderia sp. NMBU_R16]NRO95056.1 GNAT family N-acetyltransferase [Paraburkholderia sp. NMBU_R16]
MPIDDYQSVIVRRFINSDIAAALELISQIGSPDDLARAAREQFTRELDAPHDEEVRFVAIYRSMVVGTMGCGPGPLPSKQALWADWLVVDRNHRRRKIASLLYEKVEEFASIRKKTYLCLDIGNIDNERAAFTFHLRNGFQIVGQLPDYWGELEHLNIMAKRLTPMDRRQ